jgi:hypothetical protein
LADVAQATLNLKLSKKRTGGAEMYRRLFLVENGELKVENGDRRSGASQLLVLNS